LVETRLQLLRRWRSVVEIVARVVGELYSEAEVYLFGGAAEGRLTVLSDIDVAVVFDEPLDLEKRAEIASTVWEKLEEYGVPPYYPLHLVILSRAEFEKLRGSKVRVSKAERKL